MKRILERLSRSDRMKIMAVAGLVFAIAAIAIIISMSARSNQNGEYPLGYSDEVGRWAHEYEIDPYLVYAVIRTESGFDPLAESHAGARGLMQMTSDTFDWIKQKIAPEEPITFEDLYKPEVAIRFGACFLSMSLARYGDDVSTAAAAYHSGWGTVDRLLQDSQYTQDGLRLSNFPYRQMNHYVNKVNKNHEKYIEMYSQSESERK